MPAKREVTQFSLTEFTTFDETTADMARVKNKAMGLFLSQVQSANGLGHVKGIENVGGADNVVRFRVLADEKDAWSFEPVAKLPVETFLAKKHAAARAEAEKKARELLSNPTELRKFIDQAFEVIGRRLAATLLEESKSVSRAAKKPVKKPVKKAAPKVEKVQRVVKKVDPFEAAYRQREREARAAFREHQEEVRKAKRQEA